MDGAWIALVGTLLGAAVSYAFQRLNDDRAESRDRQQRLRDDRLEAYAAFSAALMDWRRSQVVRRSIDHSVAGVRDEYVLAVEDENRRVRATAWSAFYRVKLVCDDVNIENAAKAAVEAVRAMKHANDRAKLDDLGDLGRDALEKFLKLSSHQLLGRTE